MNSCPTRCSRLSAASCFSTADGALGAGADAAEGGGEVTADGVVDAGGDEGAGVVVGEEGETDGVPSAVAWPELDGPLEQPEAVTRSTPAVAMLTLIDAMDGNLRMVNREFVGGGFPPTSLPRDKQRCPGHMLRASGRGITKKLSRSARCSLCRRRKGVDNPVHRCVVVSGGKEPGFEDRRRKVDA